MGMFDSIYYNGLEYQTKDTPKQLCDYYAIEGGELWYQEYDAEWVEDEGSIVKGYLKHSNERWVRCSDFTDTIHFYRSNGRNSWEEYRAVIENGKVVSIEEYTERWEK